MKSHIIGFLLVTLAQIPMPIKIGTTFQNKLLPSDRVHIFFPKNCEKYREIWLTPSASSDHAAAVPTSAAISPPPIHHAAAMQILLAHSGAMQILLAHRAATRIIIVEKECP